MQTHPLPHPLFAGGLCLRRNTSYFFSLYNVRCLVSKTNKRSRSMASNANSSPPTAFHKDNSGPHRRWAPHTYQEYHCGMFRGRHAGAWCWSVIPSPRQQEKLSNAIHVVCATNSCPRISRRENSNQVRNSIKLYSVLRWLRRMGCSCWPAAPAQCKRKAKSLLKKCPQPSFCTAKKKT